MTFKRGEQKSKAVAPVRVACCQFAPTVGDRQGNLDQCASFIERAARGGANIVVLPELASSGYVFETRAEARSLADAYDGGAATTLWVRLARDLGVHIVGGFCEDAGNKLHNAAGVIGPAGKVGLFRKVHLWGDENLFFAAGDLGFPVFATPLGLIGVAVCYDGWFPECYRTMALAGAELVCVPTNWVPIPGQDPKREAMANVLTMAAAHSNSVCIAAADRVGTERGQLFIGQSLIVDHTGWPVAGPASDTDEAIVFADLDLAATKRARAWNEFNHPLRDRRTEAYHL
jgi:N-carbamoylputrescine amidase